jgi:hypothetical protein
MGDFIIKFQDVIPIAIVPVPDPVTTRRGTCRFIIADISVQAR